MNHFSATEAQLSLWADTIHNLHKSTILGTYYVDRKYELMLVAPNYKVQPQQR